MTKKKIIINMIISFVLALILTFLSVFVPVTVESFRDLEIVSFGRPFPFLTQSFNGVVRAERFPLRVFPELSDISLSVFDLYSFVWSFVIIFVVTAVIIFWFTMVRKRLRERRLEEIEKRDENLR